MQIHSEYASESNIYKNSNGITNPTLLGMTIKDKCENLVVATDVEGATLISIKLETTIVLATIAPNLAIITKDLKVDVRIKEIEALVTE
jgi:hypothetical protein